MDERLKFVAAHRAGRESMVALCERFGISRKTGYKILGRYEREGPEALRDRSRAPRTHPNQTPTELEAEILRVRRRHPTWGSKKILAVLDRERPDVRWPARSTIDAILKRAGVVSSRKRRARGPARCAPVVDVQRPNDAWSIDFKGWFRVGDGTRCDPLTVNDVFSRASLQLRAMVRPKLEDVGRYLEEAFWTYGLPRVLLSDNGSPFASRGLAGLSRLSVWLLRLGVKPVFIQPGRPDQNGRHERFHRTLKRETASPPRATIRAQQRAFSDFSAVYNEERPHEALGMRTPADVYDFSPRSMPDELQDHAYGAGLEARRVRTDGSIKWNGARVFIGEAMQGELVGLEAVGEELWHVYLGPLRLGALSQRAKIVVPLAEDQVSPVCPDSTESGE